MAFALRTHHTEFKRGLGDLKDTGKAICAFANSDGGVVILGVDNSGAALEATKIR